MGLVADSVGLKVRAAEATAYSSPTGAYADDNTLVVTIAGEHPGILATSKR